MDVLDYLIKICSIGLITIAGISWIIYFSIRTLSKYTDFGKQKKDQDEKQERTYNSSDDVPALKRDGPEEFFYETPKIETSFGNKRIGDVYEHPKKT